MFRAWRAVALDPDLEIEQWWIDRAPAGILHTAKHNGIFPAVEDDIE